MFGIAKREFLSCTFLFTTEVNAYNLISEAAPDVILLYFCLWFYARVHQNKARCFLPASFVPAFNHTEVSEWSSKVHFNFFYHFQDSNSKTLVFYYPTQSSTSKSTFSLQNRNIFSYKIEIFCKWECLETALFLTKTKNLIRARLFLNGSPLKGFLRYSSLPKKTSPLGRWHLNSSSSQIFMLKKKYFRWIAI